MPLDLDAWTCLRNGLESARGVPEGQCPLLRVTADVTRKRTMLGPAEPKLGDLLEMERASEASHIPK